MSELNRILYAEDEPDIRMIVQIAFEATSPCTMEFAENGKKLLEKVDDYKPDLILLDVMMPEMDGITTLLELRKKDSTKDIPVVFMTAKAQLHELEQLKELNVLGIVIKPFAPVNLYSTIKEMWDKNNGENV